MGWTWRRFYRDVSLTFYFRFLFYSPICTLGSDAVSYFFFLYCAVMFLSIHREPGAILGVVFVGAHVPLKIEPLQETVKEAQE